MSSLTLILIDVILLVILLMLSVPLPVCFGGALLFLSLFGDVSMKTMSPQELYFWPVLCSFWRGPIWVEAESQNICWTV